MRHHDTTPPREGERVRCIRPYLVAIDHPGGESWTHEGDTGRVVGVEIPNGIIWVRLDRAVPGLEACEMAVTSENAHEDDAAAGDMVAHFWRHFSRRHDTTPPEEHPRAAVLSESCRIDWQCIEDGDYNPAAHRFAVVTWSVVLDRNWAYGANTYAAAQDVAGGILQEGVTPGYILDTDTGREYAAALSVSFPPA